MTAGSLWIRQEVVDDLSRQALERTTVETGGILLGYVAEPTGSVVVLDTLGPGPNAVHTPSEFEPDQAWQKHQLAIRYRTSDGLLSYVGDWHTHPGGTATPSRRDRTTLRRIARYPAARLSRPAMVILGTREGAVSLRAWRWEPRRVWFLGHWPHASQMQVLTTAHWKNKDGSPH